MSRATQDTAWPRRTSHTGLSPAAVPLSRGFCSLSDRPRRGPTTPHVHRYTSGLGSSPVARHYWGNHCCFLLLRVLRCFSSPGSPPGKKNRDVRQETDGLSHSETRGSKAICASPRLIAAYHVLHRLREPRHPPCALSYFRTVPPRRTEPQRATDGRRQLILSAVLPSRFSRTGPPRVRKDSLLQSCLSQYVKDLNGATEGAEMWRITDSNR